jgi:hypothetical protein
MFGAGNADAHARLHGTVLSARRVVVAHSGQEIIVSEVRTVGFEANLCVPAGDLPDTPRPGNVIGGTVFLVASMPALLPDSGPTLKRRGWLRRLS